MVKVIQIYTWPDYKLISKTQSTLNKVTQYILRLITVFISGLLISLSTWAANFDNCQYNFYQATTPDYIDESLLKRSVPLCFDGFATLYSGVTRTPLWSAEHLTRERLYKAEEIPRDDSFHSESKLVSSMRAQVSDYKGSGFDRGHLAPNADMANESQQYDSFSLANIIPQSPKNNRYVWKNLESVTRYLTKKHGEVYVITGVAFKGKKVTQLNNRVIVPSHVFKALYIPATGEASAYFAPNDESKMVEVISIDELALRSGVDVFPSIASSAKTKVIALPTMVGDIEDREVFTQDEPTETEEEPLWYLIIVEILSWIVTNFFSK